MAGLSVELPDLEIELIVDQQCEGCGEVTGVADMDGSGVAYCKTCLRKVANALETL